MSHLYPVSKKTFSKLILVTLFIAVNFFPACTKDKLSRFEPAYDKKWIPVSQTATPIWTYPATGVSYPDLWNFAKQYFDCATDDYIVFHRDGVTNKFNSTKRCFPDQPDKDSDGKFSYHEETDSLLFLVPQNSSGPSSSSSYDVVIRSKVLDVTNEKLVIRYDQMLPFTNTLHTVTQTYNPLP